MRSIFVSVLALFFASFCFAGGGIDVKAYGGNQSQHQEASAVAESVSESSATINQGDTIVETVVTPEVDARSYTDIDHDFSQVLENKPVYNPTYNPVTSFNYRQAPDPTCDTELGYAEVGEVGHSVGTLTGCLKGQSFTNDISGAVTYAYPFVPKSVKRAREAEEKRVNREEKDSVLLEKMYQMVMSQNREITRLAQAQERQQKDLDRVIDQTDSYSGMK